METPVHQESRFQALGCAHTWLDSDRACPSILLSPPPVDSSEHRPSDVTHLNALLGNVNHQGQQLYALTADAAYTVNEDGHVMKMHAGQFIDLCEGTITVHAQVDDMLRV